jgi:hypothetical protein
MIQAALLLEELVASIFKLVLYLTYSSALKMETCSSKMMDVFCKAAWLYVPEDKTLQTKIYRNPSKVTQFFCMCCRVSNVLWNT